jgi:thiol-disulfide isomerase/thioredoxin
VPFYTINPLPIRLNKLRKLFILFAFLLAAHFVDAQTSLDTAVNFTVKDVNGVTHRLYEYLEQDKIVVIDFFTITCGPCSTYAPLISESFSHFGCNTSNVIFLGINWGADNAGVIDFGETNGVHYPEVSGTEGNGNHVVEDYGILSYPTVIVIMPDSYIAEKYIWPPTTQHLDSTISAHGGLYSICTTPVSSDIEATAVTNKILSLFPVPASSMVTCTTSLTDEGSIEIRSVSGITFGEPIPVTPGESGRIITSHLLQGYYMLVLRNKTGTIVDCKPLIIQNQ